MLSAKWVALHSICNSMYESVLLAFLANLLLHCQVSISGQIIDDLHFSLTLSKKLCL